MGRIAAGGTVGSFLIMVGRRVYPQTTFRNNSAAARSLQLRAGLVTAFCVSTGLIVLGLAVPQLINSDFGFTTPDEPNLTQLSTALALAIFSVFLPQAVFRTGNAASTREILDNPTAPIQHWRATTVTFSAILVGGMLAGLLFQSPLTLTFFGLALVAKLIFTTRHSLATDPNAHFHGIVEAWTSGAIATTAFLIVSPLAAAVAILNSLWPLVLASLVAMYLGLAFNAVERWVVSEKAPWAFAQDSIDTRRLLVALVSAFIAWAIVMVSDLVGNLIEAPSSFGENVAGFGVFIAFWLLLWFASIRMWKREAKQTLRMWREHQAEILVRLSHGTLNAELARRAALPTTARLALGVFAAIRTMTIMRSPNGVTDSAIASTGVFENSPPAKARDMQLKPNVYIPLNSNPDQTENSSIVVSGWLWPGWFMTRSQDLVNEFAALANTALFVPALASQEDPNSVAFERLFDSTYQWPNVQAFEEAVERLRVRVDLTPQSSSLLIACYAVDDFGALAGGKFEQAALAQIHRLVQGHRDFAGHDVFVAYEFPGRIWVALSSGPIIRTGVQLLHDLQTRINDSGSIPSDKVDLDVYVSVSFGYAVHQVDAISLEDLMNSCRDRLEKDFALRHSFDTSQLLPAGLTPEDFMVDSVDVVTAANTLFEFRNAINSGGDSLISLLYPITRSTSEQAQAVLIEFGWDYTIGHTSMLNPLNLMTLVDRQLELAGEASNFFTQKLIQFMTELDIQGHSTTPLMIRMPSILLNPDSGTLALPNVLGRALDRRQASRTIVLIDSIPQGSGQALRLLRDRGINISVTSTAAIGADPSDLADWDRWAVVFPGRLLSGPAQVASGLDPLTIRQTSLAIATGETRLMATFDELTDPQTLGDGPINWYIDQTVGYNSVDQVMEVATTELKGR